MSGLFRIIPPVYLFPEFLADFEKGEFLLADSYLIPRLWIPACAVSVFFDANDPKLLDLDPLAIDKSPGHGFKNRIDDFL